MTTIAQVLTDWGIDQDICIEYENRYSIRTIYDWQRDCIYETNVLDGADLVYCAPTGGGKTLISELAIIKTCTSRKKLAIYVLPYVSLVLEKEKYLKGLLSTYNKMRSGHARIQVKALHGANGTHHIRSLMKKNILICTYEKAAHIVNMMIMARIEKDAIGCCVVDEFHHIGSKFNGPTLESLLCKLRYFTGTTHLDERRINSSSGSLQIIGLSATIGNVEALANWLQANLFITHHRPICLSQFIVSRGIPFNILNPEVGLESLIPAISATSENTPIKGLDESQWEEEALLALCFKALSAGNQMLIFCPTKMKCSQTCIFLAERLTYLNLHKHTQFMHLRQEWIAQLRTLDEGSLNLLSSFKNSIQQGVAFHHAGLSENERGSVEDAFKSGVLRILACTTTLAAGVNLPANIVVIRGLRIGKEIVSSGQYQQMCGRAGRPGYGGGRAAEAYLLIKQNEWQDALDLATLPLPDVRSVLDQNRIGTGTTTTLTHLVIEVFSLGLVNSIMSVLNFLHLTLLYSQATVRERKDIELATLACINYLIEIGALQASENEHRMQQRVRQKETSIPSHKLEPTRFGKAIVQGGFAIEDAGKLLTLFFCSMRAVLIILCCFQCAKMSLTLDMFSISKIWYIFDNHLTYFFFTVIIYNELVLAQDCLQLGSQLHCLFLISPLAGSTSIDVDWGFLFDACARQSTPLSAKTNRVRDPDLESLVSILKFHDVREAVLLNWHKFSAPSKFVQECFQASRLAGTKMEPHKLRQLGTCVRVWAAWMLLQLVKGASHEQVCRKHGIESGNLYDLVMHANIMTRKMQRFSKEMGWKSLEALFLELKSIIAEVEGKNEELLPLLACKCKEMTPKVARCLWNNDIRDPWKLAETPLREIAYKLQLDLGFVSNTLAFNASHDNNFSRQTSADDEDADENIVATIGTTENEFSETRDEYQHSVLLVYVSRLQSSARDVLTSRDRKAVASLNEIQSFLLLEKEQLCGLGEGLDHDALNGDSDSDEDGSGSVHKSNNFLYDATCSENSALRSSYTCINKLPHMATQDIFNGGFVMKHLCSQQHWHAFLDHISTVKCASLQVVFRRIPRTSSILAKSTESMHSWTEFVSSCLYSHTEDGLKDNEDWYRTTRLTETSKDPHVIAGVGLCFSGSDAYFLPLPIPLPLVIFRCAEVSSHSAGIATLPASCRELICCFVGEFNCWVGPPSSLSASNSCLLLNRQWATSARIALRKQWQKNGSLAWECLRHLLESPDVTIVGQNLQSQLEALHKRGLQCVRGHQYDSEVLCPMNGEELPLRLPSIAQTCSDKSASRNICSARRACFRAIAVLRFISAHLQLCH